MKGNDGLTHPEATAFNRLDDVIVAYTTWISAAFLAILLLIGLLTADSKFLVRAINPMGPLLAGLWMLQRGRPRAIIQIVAGSLAVVIGSGFLDIEARPGALLGLFSMGIVGVLLVRLRAATFVAGFALALLGVAAWWGDTELAILDRLAEGSSWALAFLFTGSLVTWLRGRWIAEADRGRRVSAALVASEEQFRTAFETAAAMMTLIDLDTAGFLRVNDAGCRLLGYSEAELLDMTVADIVHPSESAASQERLRRLRERETQQISAGVRFLRAGGADAYGRLSIALVTDADGKPRHLVGQLIDTTDQHEAEQGLLDMLASRDELIAAVSHELRTPLTSVIGYAALLAESTPQPPPDGYEDMLGEILAQGTDLSAIIEDLLVFARGESGSIIVNPVALDLREQVTTVMDSVQSTSTEAQIAFKGGPVSAIGDPLRVRQVLRNLLTNAIRYGGESITLDLDEREGSILVSVTDNGPGVPKSEHERIFQPYQRGKQEEGLTASIGMGLTVARRLARLMEGDLSYDYADGRSRFEFSLPAAPTQVTSSADD